MAASQYGTDNNCFTAINTLTSTALNQETVRMLLTGTTATISNVGDDATLILAAGELQKFLHEAAAVTVEAAGLLHIDLVVESCQGYRVSLARNTLRFVGPTPVEVLYAVYTFAQEQLGYLFFEPGKDRLTRLEQIELHDGDVVTERIPVLKTRGFVQEYPADQTNYALADWMAKNRLNYLMTWMKYYDQFAPQLRDYYAVRGIQIEAGHHNFDYYVPFEEYGSTHPEYFAMRDGHRVKVEADDNPLLLSKQLCVTNSSVRDILVDRMIAYAEANPKLNRVALVPNDGFGWCECDKCSRFYDTSKKGKMYSIAEHVYEAQDIYHDLVQDVAERLHKKRPDLTMTFAAYVNYVNPAEGFKLKPDLALHLALYWRCYNHDIDDPSCDINRQYLASLAKWHEASAGGELNVYEYYMGVNFYVSLPMVFHEKIFHEVKALRATGVKGVTTQYHLQHWTAYGLNYVMFANAAYGEDVSAVEPYLHKLFGPGAEAAQTFYAALHQLQLSVSGDCLVPVPYLLFSRTTLGQYEHMKVLAQAVADQSPNERLAARLVVWMEYLVRFKSLFDRYHAGEDIRQDIALFKTWAQHIQSEHDVCMADRLEWLLDAWIKKIETNEPWYHFNLEWEDDYVRRYGKMWGAISSSISS
jgi:hypothetical protein